MEQEAPSAGLRLGLAGHLLGDQETGSTPSSPRRFANQGMVGAGAGAGAERGRGFEHWLSGDAQVYLSEIQSIEDLGELSTKQVKELLAMNRWANISTRSLVYTPVSPLFQGEL